MIPMGAVRQRVRKWESSMRKVKRRGERMRSTLIRLPRRLRQDVAVGLVAAAVFSGLAACHAGGTRSSAHGSASTAGALDGKVPSNVEICNLLPAGEFEEHAGAQVERFELSHAPHDTYPSLLCTIDYDRAVQSDFDFLSVRYGKASHDGSSSLEQEVSQSSGNSKVRSFSVQELEGEGVSYYEDQGAYAALWEFPDGRGLGVLLSIRSTVSRDSVEDPREFLEWFVGRVALRVSELAASPVQGSTSYPT